VAQNILDVEARSAGEAIALGYFKAIVTRDFARMEEIFAEDALQHNPWPAEGFGKFAEKTFAGRQAIVDHYRAALTNRRDHVFWIDQVHQTLDPDVIIVEAHAHSVLGETGSVYENEYICVFRLKDGLIHEMSEYTNPLAAMRAFAGAFGSQKAD
jgi:ketosteroid isomerase-like protein